GFRAAKRSGLLQQDHPSSDQDRVRDLRSGHDVVAHRRGRRGGTGGDSADLATLGRTMKSPRCHSSCGTNAGFTLLEMIGVIAIMSILASVLVPNMLRSIDGAASRAEAETMRHLGTALEGYLKKNEALPVAENPAVAPPAVPWW